MSQSAQLFPLIRPTLSEFESTATVDCRVEKLSKREFEILSQLLRYPEETIPRDSLKRIGGDDGSMSDRKLDALMNILIRKTNVLCPQFPVVRFSPPDGYIYTEQPPKKKRQDGENT